MGGRGEHTGSVAIIGMACRFPGARDPAELHDLTVSGRPMFQSAAGPTGRALLDDWPVPRTAAGDPLSGDFELGETGAGTRPVRPAR